METNQTGTERTGSRKPFIAALVCLLLLLGVTTYFTFSEKHQKEVVTAEQVQLQAEFAKITDTLNVRSTEMSLLRGKNAEMDKTIAANQISIDNQKKEINRLLSKGKLTSGELAKAREMIAQYKGDITNLQTQIAALEVDKQKLTEQNTSLTADLGKEKETTIQLTDQNKGLSKQVEIGSLLPINNMEVEGVRTRIAGKEVRTKKAKSTEAIKIAFETGSNKLLPAGPVSLYVRVINPKGETIATGDQGQEQAVIQSQEGSGAIQYSKKADIDYSNTNKKVSMYWDKNINTPGTYKVEVYQGGYMVGKGDVTLN